MIGGSACHDIHMAVDVLVACVGIVFFELKVFFDRHILCPIMVGLELTAGRPVLKRLEKLHNDLGDQHFVDGESRSIIFLCDKLVDMSIHAPLY